MIKKSILFLSFALCTVWAQRNDNILFQSEPADNTDHRNALDKQPISSSPRCLPDELLYPGDQFNDWVCDCRPAHLFVPERERCYEAYRQGPCSSGQYLILPSNSAIPLCALNNCGKDGQVRYAGKCYELGSRGPCGLGELNTELGVNETTLQIQCIVPRHLPQPGVIMRFGDEDDEAGNPLEPIEVPKVEITDCYNGSRRSYKRKCLESSRTRI